MIGGGGVAAASVPENWRFNARRLLQPVNSRSQGRNLRPQRFQFILWIGHAGKLSHLFPQRKGFVLAVSQVAVSTDEEVRTSRNTVTEALLTRALASGKLE